jgi:ribose-phosphate pyrophosphokinase
MIRTGGSLIGAAHAFRAAGATRISAVATHGVFPGDAFARLNATGLFDAIACTDSHPRARALAAEGLVVTSVVPLLADRIRAPEDSG